MPTLSRYFIRSSLLYMGIGFTFGGLILCAKSGYVDPRVWGWLPMHIVLLTGGWLVQLTLGVAYWILPRIQGSERGRRGWAWLGFAILQAGLALTLVTALNLWVPAVQGLFAPAVIVQLIGVAMVVVHAYPRIRPALARIAPSAR